MAEGSQEVGVVPGRCLIRLPEMIAAIDGIVAEKVFPTLAQMTELHLLHFHQYVFHLPFAVYHQSIVGLVVEMRRTADIIERRRINETFLIFRQLGGVCHKDNQYIVGLSETSQSIKKRAYLKGLTPGVASLRLDTVVGNQTRTRRHLERFVESAVFDVYKFILKEIVEIHSGYRSISAGHALHALRHPLHGEGSGRYAA